MICYTGDGGLYYHISELETAARLGINVVVVVNDNASLSQTQKGFGAAYGGVQRGKAHQLWRYNNVDFAAIAESMGCLGLRVERPEQIAPSLRQALAAGRPALVDVVTDLTALPPNAWG
ncbi:MAG: thiamine pyrophosphate-dependent enzyme [Chloroflexi bacterium]|nr:thiamine pyrophosphate-dependent enzyme [Chloroflexota bacterium]